MIDVTSLPHRCRRFSWGGAFFDFRVFNLVDSASSRGLTVAVVDAHQHFWDPELVSYPWLATAYPELNRRFGFDDLAPFLQRERRRRHGARPVRR